MVQRRLSPFHLYGNAPVKKPWSRNKSEPLSTAEYWCESECLPLWLSNDRRELEERRLSIWNVFDLDFSVFMRAKISSSGLKTQIILYGEHILVSTRPKDESLELNFVLCHQFESMPVKWETSRDFNLLVSSSSHKKVLDNIIVCSCQQGLFLNPSMLVRSRTRQKLLRSETWESAAFSIRDASGFTLSFS